MTALAGSPWAVGYFGSSHRRGHGNGATTAQTPAARPELRAHARDLETMLEAAAERGARRALEAVGAVTEATGLSRIAAPQRPVEPPKKPSEPVDARTVAEALGLTPQTVRAHWRELGGRRLHDGPKAPIRFDLEAILDGSACRTSLRSVEPDTGPEASPEAKSRPSRRRARTPSADGLPLPASGLPNEAPVGRILASRPRGAARNGR